MFTDGETLQELQRLIKYLPKTKLFKGKVDLTNKRIVFLIAIISVLVVAFSASIAFKPLNSDRENSGDNPGTSTTAESTTKQNGNETTAPSTPPETTVPEPKRISIIATGDTMMGRGVGNRLISQGKNPEFAFEPIKNILDMGDIVFTNLETPITSSEHGLDPAKKYVLKMKPELMDNLLYAGFNMVSLANNHLMDFYERGLVDTMDILSANDIVFAGAGMNLQEARKAAIKEVEGVRVGLLAYTDMAHFVYAGNPSIKHGADEDKSGVAQRKLEYVLEDIDAIRDEVDILMVSLHWGTEESFVVSEDQREFAYKVLDKGADIILGHHPHQFQGIEIYNGKPIIYSMGNLIMDQNDPENQETFLVLMDYEDGEFKKMRCYPARTIDKVQVKLLNSNEAGEMLERQIKLCKQLGTDFEAIDGVLEYSVSPKSEG